MNGSITTPVVRFWNLLRPFSKQIRQIYVYAFFAGVVTLTLPLGIQAIVNFLQTGQFTSTWLILVGFVLLGIAVSGVLQVMQLRIVENMQQELFAKSAFEFAFRLPRISFIELDKVHAPELANRFFDTLTIQKGLPKILIDLSLAAFQIIFGLILLTIYSPFFIVLGFALAVILWLIFKFTGPNGLKTSLVESKYKYKMAHWLEEIARVNRSFKINVDSSFHLDRTDHIVGQYITAREKHFKVLLNQFRLFVGFKVFVAAGLLVLGGVLVFQERMNIGQFVAAEIIILLIINSVEKVLRIIDSIYDILTALEKIGYVTDLELYKRYGSSKIESEEGMSVKADKIHFGFEGDRQKIFENLSFEMKSNDKVILTGRSGSGKSILLQILSGIHKLQEGGRLFINGMPRFSYDRHSFYQNIGVVFPVNQIFEGSFKQNILMGRDISERRLQGVINLLGLREFLNYQNEGIDTHIDSGGRRLPRAIIQKIVIARAIIHEPKLLLLEDPLQFIEEDEKKRIVDFIMEKDRKWTVVVVSDFPYWEKKSNRIIDLQKN